MFVGEHFEVFSIIALRCYEIVGRELYLYFPTLSGCRLASLPPDLWRFLFGVESGRSDEVLQTLQRFLHVISARRCRKASLAVIPALNRTLNVYLLFFLIFLDLVNNLFFAEGGNNRNGKMRK